MGKIWKKYNNFVIDVVLEGLNYDNYTQIHHFVVNCDIWGVGGLNV